MRFDKSIWFQASRSYSGVLFNMILDEALCSSQLLKESYHKNLNLLTNKEDVFAAFELMEGPGWLRDELKYVRGETLDVYLNNSIVGCLEWLKNRSDADTGSYIIYGSGGYHRYSVRPNGDVRFSAGHALKEKTQQAKDLGFEVFGEVRR